MLVRLGLAAVWLVAGGAKVGDLAGSGRAVNAYDVMPYELAKVIGA
ncbi:DoxX family protein, partial [Phytohabitans sp. LJ34]